MKVLVGYFTTESNANVPLKNDITNYVIAVGEDCIHKMQVEDILPMPASK